MFGKGKWLREKEGKKRDKWTSKSLGPSLRSKAKQNILLSVHPIPTP